LITAIGGAGNFYMRARILAAAGSAYDQEWFVCFFNCPGVFDPCSALCRDTWEFRLPYYPTGKSNSGQNKMFGFCAFLNNPVVVLFANLIALSGDQRIRVVKIFLKNFGCPGIPGETMALMYGCVCRQAFNMVQDVCTEVPGIG
jgi:hypothetical protein